MHLTTVEIETLGEIRGIPFPRGTPFRQILITGPLGSGKTTLVEAIRGWTEEGFVDLAMSNWWRSRQLSVRPREVHFGIPFVGHDAVAPGAWPEAPIDLDRIRLPPTKARFFNVDWRAKFVFDIQLPPTEQIYEGRKARARLGSHPPDEMLTLEKVRREVVAYEALAVHFQRNGLRVYVRNSFQGPPRRILDPSAHDHPFPGPTGAPPEAS